MKPPADFCVRSCLAGSVLPGHSLAYIYLQAAVLPCPPLGGPWCRGDPCSGPGRASPAKALGETQGGKSMQGAKPSILMMHFLALSSVTLFVNAAICSNLHFGSTKSSP